ncbi:hypothetical protein Tco_0524172 [Tanacetum coccineum]
MECTLLDTTYSLKGDDSLRMKKISLHQMLAMLKHDDVYGVYEVHHLSIETEVEEMRPETAESSVAAAARAPRGQYDFVDTIEAGQGLIRSPGHDARTIARAADRVEDVGYVRALQAFEHNMMTSIEEVNLRVSYQAQFRRKESEDFYTQLHDARTNRRDIRLEIDVVRGQKAAYETELHTVRQVYLSSEAQNRALLVRLETLKTHMSRMEWQRQSAKDDAVKER